MSGLKAPEWPKGPTCWTEGRTLKVSVPFTWNLPAVHAQIAQGSVFYDRVEVGGPALSLMPDYFADLPHVTVGQCENGVLQRVNPLATRTTTGCIRKCSFCGIGTGKIEAGGFVELEEWENLPIVCDNNFLAASDGHIERVVDKLRPWGWADFNQGLDARLLTQEKAAVLNSIGKVICRLACDSPTDKDAFENAFSRLLRAGVAKKRIRSLVLIGFKTGPDEAWQRCLWIERHGIPPSPMWFHPLNALRWNEVTEEQRRLGWNEQERTRIMGYFYKRRGTPYGTKPVPPVLPLLEAAI